MSDDHVSVAEAAEMLGVHLQRIHQRIRDGSLPAHKVGHQWVLDKRDLRRIRHESHAGRPLSSKSAWDLLAVAAGDDFASALSPSARSRAHSRLRRLIERASVEELADAAAAISKALRNRAQRAAFTASPRDLPDVRADGRVHLSGVSLGESNLSASDIVEGYVRSSDVHDLVDDYLLSPARAFDANVVLHVVSSAASHPVLDDLNAVAGSALAMTADLAEHGGARELNEAVRLLSGLHSQVGRHGRSTEVVADG